MRHLLQPRVLNQAIIAALATALACYPTMTLGLVRSAPVWFLETTIFLCSIVLWAFVFAWHEPYAHRPVWIFKLELGPFAAVTLFGLAAAVVIHVWLDPPLRAVTPGEYPTNLKHWFALVLFSLAFNQLFLLFAPFAWLMRLCQNRRVAAVLTVSFGVLVCALKYESLPSPLPTWLFATFLAVKVTTGFLAIWCYLRGGIILCWWWTFLFESRLLLDFPESS